MNTRIFAAIAFATVVCVPASGLALPSVEIHTNLTPDGDFATGLGTWSTLFGTCNHDAADGRPAPAAKCDAVLSAEGFVNCPSPPFTPDQCNSHAEASGAAGVVRDVTLPPVFIGQVGGVRVQRYEISASAHAVIEGVVSGTQENRGGNANLNLQATFFSPLGDQIAQAGLGGAGTGTCCGNFQLNADSGWFDSYRAPVSGLGDYAGQTIQVAVVGWCDAKADQFGTDTPVKVDATCTAVFDNVRFDVYYTTG